MAFNLRNRNFLKLLDFTPKEIKFLLDLSIDLKKAKYSMDDHLASFGGSNHFGFDPLPF